LPRRAAARRRTSPGENLFNVVAKLGMTPIHFRGAGPAVTAVVSGEPAIGSMAISGPLPAHQERKVARIGRLERKTRPFPSRRAYFCRSGLSRLQDYTWVGIFFPAGTPSAVVHKLQRVGQPGAAKRRICSSGWKRTASIPSADRWTKPPNT